MSRTTVRAAVADSLRNAKIDNVVQVYSSHPRTRIAGETARQGHARKASGARLWVEIPTDEETRIAMGGKKRIDYDVALHVTYFGPTSSDSTETTYEALDIIVDDLRDHIRTDTTLGNTVFSSGEGAIPIITDYGDIEESQTNFEISSVITFRVTEIINA